MVLETQPSAKMNNYADFQGPVAEWEEFVQSAGIPPPPALHLPVLEMRSQVNAGRTATAQAQVKAQGSPTPFCGNADCFLCVCVCSKGQGTKLTDLVRNKTGLLEKVSWRDYSILTQDSQNIIARVYKPKSSSLDTLLPVYLYFHGGGHLYGNVDGEDASCSRIVAESPAPGVIVVNVNYRHTPEFVWPTQLNDAWDSFVWLSQHMSTIGGDPSQVVIGGVSAGGGLAASVVQRHHHHHHQVLQATGHHPTTSVSSGLTVRGQVLCSPWLLHPLANPKPKSLSSSQQPLSSFNQNQEAPVLPWSILKVFADLLGPAAVSDPSFNVALATDEHLRGLPKTSSLIAGQDLLRDEGLYYADRLKANG